MKPDVINFLRAEAHRMYLGLDFKQRSLTTEKTIYRGLKAAWKKGATLKQEARVKARNMPLNFKDLPEEYKEKYRNTASVANVGLY